MKFITLSILIYPRTSVHTTKNTSLPLDDNYICQQKVDSCLLLVNGHEPAESLRVDEVEGVAADLKLRVGERLTAVLGTQSETRQAA